MVWCRSPHNGSSCLVVRKATNIIIHGLHIHHCKSQPPSTVMGPDSKLIPLGQMDGDAIRLVMARKVWIDHKHCLSAKMVSLMLLVVQPMLLYLTIGLGTKIKVRHGYAHVANNFYQGWEQYAIGGRKRPSIKSEANLLLLQMLATRRLHGEKAKGG
ncbi:Detected protein of unknown function [Hibiscus syriacus]|uniref:Pectate lyase domain-containing protein n=1 Tax=Hibiscus syriacus TaxID=106335 RepID=A0A6A2ZD96_HIBSY|nr:Detected protein of unknown function [Hibiscus syriacus]